jgi:drug/metabolite transporter (DMT)-like permease
MAMNFRESYIRSMKATDKSVGRAVLLIVISALSFGSISVLTVLVTRQQVSLITAMAWRYFLAAVILALMIRPFRHRGISRRQIAQLMLIGGVGQALITYLSLHALEYIAVGPLAFLFYTYPAWVALLAAVRKTERLTTIRMLALTLALIGVTIMVGAPEEKLNAIGVALALASAILYSAYLPALEQIQRGIPSFHATFYLISGSAIAFVLAALMLGQFYVPDGGAVWINILTLAIVSTVIAFSALIKGVSILGPVRTSIIATVEPFFTAVLGVMALGSQFTATTLVGGALIGSAILVIELSAGRDAAEIIG